MYNNPDQLISYVFKDSLYEYIQLDKYAHALVDAKAFDKSLPINYLASYYFRNNFKIYEINARVLGPVLLFGSLDHNKKIDYKHHSIPIDYITYVLKIPYLPYTNAEKP